MIGRSYQSVGGAPLVLLGDVSDVGEDHGEGDGEDPRDGDQSEVPPGDREGAPASEQKTCGVT